MCCSARTHSVLGTQFCGAMGVAFHWHLLPTDRHPQTQGLSHPRPSKVSGNSIPKVVVGGEGRDHGPLLKLQNGTLVQLLSAGGQYQVFLKTKATVKRFAYSVAKDEGNLGGKIHHEKRLR